jgi:hypothetical protein
LEGRGAVLNVEMIFSICCMQAVARLWVWHVGVILGCVMHDVSCFLMAASLEEIVFGQGLAKALQHTQHVIN